MAGHGRRLLQGTLLCFAHRPIAALGSCCSQSPCSHCPPGPAQRRNHRTGTRYEVPPIQSADAAGGQAQLASYVTEPLATEYVVENGYDPALACDAPVEYVPGMQGGPHGCLAFWGGIEYLLWWQKDAWLPPLVTTSPAGTSRDLAGVLGAPTPRRCSATNRTAATRYPVAD